MIFPIPKAAFDDRLSFVGMSGSGKTYAASGAIEHVLCDGARAIIVDPLGVWWGLRVQPDGKKPSSFDIPIFGGAHGDIALTEHAGALVGETVAGMAQSCIVDLSQIGTKAGERRFMLAFLTALYRGVNGIQVHLVFDEADMWAPQRLLDKDGDAAKLLGMMETIVRRGRVRGFIPWLITQRPAVLSKDVLSQSDGIVSFKLTASQDRDAIGAWIDGQADRQEGKVILGSLPSLERGRGVVWIPSRKVLHTANFPVKATYDSSRAPKRGETRRDAVLKTLDLGELRTRLAKVEAETKANDPKTLKIEIADLRRQLGQKTNGADQDTVRKAEAAAYARGTEDGFARAIQGIAAEAEIVIKAIHGAANAAAQLSIWAAGATLQKSAPIRATPTLAAPAPRATPPQANPTPAADGLTTPQRRVMNSLAFWRSIGNEQPTREQVAAVAGYRPGSGNFNNIVGGLSSAGQTTIPAPGRLALLVDFEGSTPEQARDVLWSIFDNPQKRLVEAAKAARDDLARDDLASAAGYAPGSGNFNNIAGKLTTMDVLQRTGTGRLGLSEWARTVLS